MDGLPSSGSGLLALRAVIPSEALSNHRSHLPSGCFRGACLSSLLPPSLFTGGPGVEVALQGLERVGPHRLIFRDPLVELGEALGLDRVDPLLRAAGDFDELGVTDFSGGSSIPVLAEFGHPGSLSTCNLPWLRRIELHRTRTSFNGLPSFPSMPVSRCTNM